MQEWETLSIFDFLGRCHRHSISQHHNIRNKINIPIPRIPAPLVLQAWKTTQSLCEVRCAQGWELFSFRSYLGPRRLGEERNRVFIENPLWYMFFAQYGQWSASISPCSTTHTMRLPRMRSVNIFGQESCSKKLSTFSEPALATNRCKSTSCAKSHHPDKCDCNCKCNWKQNQNYWKYFHRTFSCRDYLFQQQILSLSTSHLSFFTTLTHLFSSLSCLVLAPPFFGTLSLSFFSLLVDRHKLDTVALLHNCFLFLSRALDHIPNAFALAQTCHKTDSHLTW